ncbi:hypothetical protein Q5425_02690 [Amycolatopsis sp. A133]|jgi:hypothetical protein|uniref:hypothetical protein n=1 Tax=Amycolatopsis sp. A133 TaxID=3064472 RepID=UPI0027FB82F8|nr:hypothetical protein [Amycolatopsis sp. A133]MDQ7802622.1 hypothetical protein [Amycolatopsis sp. A133]
MTAPYSPPPAGFPYATPAPARKPAKFAALAWTALILGIVGVVGSPVIFLNNLTAVVAAVGFVLGGIALFGSKKILAAIGVVLSVLAIVFTVIAQNAAVEDLQDKLGLPATDDNAAGQTYQIGQTHRGTDVDITIADAKAFTTGDTAAPQQNAPATSFQVTIANHSAKPWSAAMLMVQATAGNTTAEQVFDTDLEGSPSQDVLPGKELTYRIGFLDAPGDLTIQVGAVGGDKVYFVHQR